MKATAQPHILASSHSLLFLWLQETPSSWLPSGCVFAESEAAEGCAHNRKPWDLCGAHGTKQEPKISCSLLCISTVWAPPTLKPIRFHGTFLFLPAGVFSWKSISLENSQAAAVPGPSALLFPFWCFREHLCAYQLKISPFLALLQVLIARRVERPGKGFLGFVCIIQQ